MADIHFSADLDTDKLDKAILRSKQKVGQWTKDIEKSTEGIDKGVNRISTAFEKQGNVTERILRREKGLIEDIRDTIKQYEQAKEKAWKVEDIERYNKKIAEAKQHLKEYESAGVKAADSTENFNSKLTKWVLSLGGAAAILNTLKKAFIETTQGLNAFNIAGAATQQVLYNIVSGTGSLTRGLREVIAAQRTLNELRLEEKITNFEAVKQQILFQKYSVEAHDQILTGTERIKAYDKAIEANNKMIDLQIGSLKKQRDAIEQMLLARPGSEKYKMEFADLNTQLLQLEANRYSRLKEMTSMRSGLVKKEIEDELKWREDLHNNLMKLADEYIETQNKNAQKLRDLNNEIEANKSKGQEKELLQLKQKYEADLEAYKDNEAIKAALAEKYAQDRYSIEMAYLDKVKDQNRKIAESLLKIDPGRGYAILGRSLTKGPSPLKAPTQTREDIEKQVDKNLKKELEIRKEIIANAIVFTGELIDQLDLTQEQTESLNFMLKTVGQLAQGNFLGAALGILGKIIGTFAQMGDVMSEPRWKKQIEAWDALIERQKRVIELSEETGGTELALEKAVNLAQKKLDEINAAIALARQRRGTPSQELLDAQRQAIDDLKDAQKALQDFITGGINQIDIAGVLAQGFIDGKKSARDFAEDFDGLMRQAINASLEELSKPSISAWYKKFAADMASGGGLNADEIVALKKEWDTIVAAEEERRKQIYAIAGINETSMANVGLSGQIRRDITEETGTELAALFRRYADEQRVVKDYSIQGVSHLVGIEANTAETVNKLQLAINELQSININTKQPAVAGLG